MRIVFVGLTITSSWGNGHAVTYRGLVRELCRLGHDVLFLERDAPWYAANRDLTVPPYGRTVLYGSAEELRTVHAETIATADVVVVGSYVPDGVEIGEFVTETAQGLACFYDIDTPVTLAALARRACSYLTPALIPRYDLYFSFTGGPTLDRLEKTYGAPRARALYCSADTEAYLPRQSEIRYDLGYMGTYSDDRQPGLEALLLEPARTLPWRRFAVAGPQYPAHIAWPANVVRFEHLPPARHAGFYASQRYTLNLTRADMKAAGHSPSIRLFEAAACATPIISDAWDGLDELFAPGREILIAKTPGDVAGYLQDVPEADRLALGRAARERIMANHTAACRARQFVADAQSAPPRLPAKRRRDAARKRPAATMAA